MKCWGGKLCSGNERSDLIIEVVDCNFPGKLVGLVSKQLDGVDSERWSDGVN